MKLVTLSSLSFCRFFSVNSRYYYYVIWTYVRSKTVTRVHSYLLVFEQKILLIYCWWMSYLLLKITKCHRVYSQKNSWSDTLIRVNYRISLNTISIISVESNFYFCEAAIICGIGYIIHYKIVTSQRKESIVWIKEVIIDENLLNSSKTRETECLGDSKVITQSSSQQ